MSTPEIGEVYIAAGIRYEVIGINDPEDGCGVQVWMRNVKSGAARTCSEEIVESWDKVKPFFEEQANYCSTLNGDVITVWHVHRMANGLVAIVQDSKGEPHLMHERHFGFWEKL